MSDTPSSAHPPNPIPPGLSPAHGFPPKFSGPQKALYEALLRLREGPRLAKIYLGALVVLDDVRNPEHLAQAAHSLRELMDRIPEYINVPIIASKETLKERVRALEDHWQSALRKSKGNGFQSQDGQIAPCFLPFLVEVDSFFRWFAEHRPRRKEEVAKILRKIDGSDRKMPTPLENRNVREWDVMKRFFEAVCHHGNDATIEDFCRELAALETFLLDRVCPRTFADLDMIDSLIREDSGNADT